MTCPASRAISKSHKIKPGFSKKAIQKTICVRSFSDFWPLRRQFLLMWAPKIGLRFRACTTTTAYAPGVHHWHHHMRTGCAPPLPHAHHHHRMRTRYAPPPPHAQQACTTTTTCAPGVHHHHRMRTACAPGVHPTTTACAPGVHRDDRLYLCTLPLQIESRD